MSDRVQTVPPPPHLLHDLEHSINDALTSVTMRGSERNAYIEVGVKNQTGKITFNAAIVANTGTGWEVKGWVAKVWDGDVEAGATVKFAW